MDKVTGQCPQTTTFFFLKKGEPSCPTDETMSIEAPCVLTPSEPVWPSGKALGW